MKLITVAPLLFINTVWGLDVSLYMKTQGDTSAGIYYVAPVHTNNVCCKYFRPNAQYRHKLSSLNLESDNVPSEYNDKSHSFQTNDKNRIGNCVFWA